MTRELTEREAFASLLASLVLQRCIESKRRKTSRTGLQSTVPVDERPCVSRGLDALVDHGMLAMTGEDIGFTQHGNVFLAFVSSVEEESATLDEDINGHVVLTPLLAAIARDERLSPPRPLKDIRTLPARLENHRAPRRNSLINRWTMLAGAAAAAGMFAVALTIRNLSA